jgi:pilus assembly protein CpaF
MTPTHPTEADASLVARVHRQVLDHSMLVGCPVDRRRAFVADLVRAESPLLGRAALAEVVDQVLGEVSGMGCLDPFLADPDVTEIMVNGPGPVWIERAGTLERTAVVVTEVEVAHLIEKAVGPLGLRVDRSSPLVDARLPDGSRVNAVVPPLAVDGPCLTIRRFGVVPVPLAQLAPGGVGALLAWAVSARRNLVVSGGTGAGKTTLLNALAVHLGRTERLITVEDVAELRLPHEHVVRLEARPANADGAGRVDIRDLVRNALRMRPDRVLVGEVRGPEALDMVQAMNTGHEGSLSTCHANSPADALARLETMILLGEVGLPLPAVRDQIVSAVDLVVQVARRADGGRAVVEVAEVGARVDADGRPVVRPLTVDAVLRELPQRPGRGGSAPEPDPGWVGER